MSESESVGTGENESENESVGTVESESESDAGFESSETIDPRYPYIQTGHELVFNFDTEGGDPLTLFANLSGSADCVNFESSDNGRSCVVIFSDVVLNCSGGKNISCDLVLSTGEDGLYISNNRYHLNSGHTHWAYYVYEKYTNTPISINDISDAESITAKYGFRYIEPQFVQSITIPINNMFANMSKPIGEIQDIPGTIIINDKDGDPIKDNETITDDKIDTIELDTNDIDFPNFGHQNKGKFVDMVIKDIIINGESLSEHNSFFGGETGEYEIGHDGELIMDESYQSSVLLLASSDYIESTTGIKLADLFKDGDNSIVIKYRFYIVNEHGWNGEQVALPSYEYVFNKHISEIIRDKLNYMFITNSGEMSSVGFSIYDGRTGDRNMSIMWPHYDSSGQFTGSGEYKIYADDINVGTFNSISSSIFSIRGNEENNIVDTINNLGKFNWISDTVPLNHEMKMVLSNGQSIVFGRSEENIRNGIYSEIDESKLTVPWITQTAEIGDIYLNETQSTKFVISGNYTDITSDNYPLYIINREYRPYAALNVFAASLITDTEDKQIESFVNVYKNDFDYTTGEFDVGSNTTKYIGKNGCIGIYCTDHQLSYNSEASYVRLYYVAKSGDKESKINTIDIPLIFDFNGTGEVTYILNSNDISIKDISLLPGGSGEIDLLLNNKILSNEIRISNIKTITGGISTIESVFLWTGSSFRISGENRLISSISRSGDVWIYPEDSSVPSKLYLDQIILNNDRVFECHGISKDINIGIKILDVNLWQDLYNGQTFGTGEIKVKIEGIDTSNSFILSGELYRYSGDEKISVGVDSIVDNENVNNNEVICYLPVSTFDYYPDTEYYLHLNSICLNNVVDKMNSTFKFIPHSNNESRIRLQSSNISATGEAILEILDPNYYYLGPENDVSISCDLYNSSNVKLHTINNDMITISKKSKNEISLYFRMYDYSEEIIYSDNCYLLLSSIKDYSTELLYDSIKIQLNT